MNIIKSSLLLLALAAITTVTSIKAEETVQTNDAYLITSNILAVAGDDYKINDHYESITVDATLVRSLDLGFEESKPLKQFKKDVTTTWPKFNRSQNSDFTRAALNLE